MFCTIIVQLAPWYTENRRSFLENWSKGLDFRSVSHGHYFSKRDEKYLMQDGVIMMHVYEAGEHIGDIKINVGQ